MTLRKAYKILKSLVPEQFQFKIRKLCEVNKDGSMIVLYEIYIETDSSIERWEDVDLYRLIDTILTDRKIKEAELISLGTEILKDSK